jgi:hypothetical protein
MDAFVRLRWSLRRAAVNSRGSGRREGIRVRSTASPFARRVGGEPRGTERAGASPGFRPLRCPTRVPALYPSRPLVPRAEAWSGQGDWQSGSSTPSRVTGALLPAAFDGHRRRLARSAGGVTGRSRVCSTFTSVAEVDERHQVRSLSSRSRPRRSEGPSSSEETRPERKGAASAMEGAPGRSNAGTVHAVRREAIRMER